MKSESIALSLLLAGSLSAQGIPQLEAPVRLKADDQLIDTGEDIGHAGAQLRDHDGDGLPDLLVSSFRGNIRFFKNVGTRTALQGRRTATSRRGTDPHPQLVMRRHQSAVRGHQW